MPGERSHRQAARRALHIAGSVPTEKQLEARWQPPAVVEGHVISARALPCYVSPLDRDPVTGKYPTALRGGIVTDPAEVEAIRARVDWYSRPPWRRALLRLAGRGEGR